jgi:anaerobic magnesium-protoporphyrin IX monomethyl ester cyclase
MGEDARHSNSPAHKARVAWADREDCLFVHVNEWAPVSSPDAVPISQAYILAHLIQHGFTGSLLGDYQDRPLRPADLAQAITERRPRIVGFSVYQENIDRVRLWARHTKRLAPDIRILLGGPQTTFMPTDALDHMPEVDFLCRGEGEAVTLGLVRALASGADPASVPGVALRRGAGTVETGRAAGADDLDTYPSPYLTDLVDLKDKKRVILLTSRGCTYPCLFCYTPQATLRGVRYHSVDRVVSEMRYLKSQGVSDFWFADPNFAHSHERLGRLLDRMIAEVPGIRFWCQARADRVTPAILEHLRRAGAHTVAYGLESACPEVLTRINKQLDIERLTEAIRWTQDLGVNVELFTMFGLPGEDWDRAMRTLDFVKEHGVRIEGNSISQQLHLFFGAKLLKNPESHGIRPKPWTKPAYMSICRDFETDRMTAQEIEGASLAWRINRSDFVEDIRQGRHIFDRAGLLTRYATVLARRPEARCQLARIYLLLEEYEAAERCLRGLLQDFPEDPGALQAASGPFLTFRTQRRGSAEPGCKVVYECQGYVDGRLVPATVGRYETAVLGSGELLGDFEQGLLGCRPRHWKEFEVAFPKDYGNQMLAGRTAHFQAVVHQILLPVVTEDLQSLSGVRRPCYRVTDMAGLREHNLELYYMVLRDTSVNALSQDMSEYFHLMEFYLKLGFKNEAEMLAGCLQQDPSLLVPAARLFRDNGVPGSALQILEPVAGANDNVELARAQSLFDCGEYQEAERIVSRMNRMNEIELLKLRAELTSRLGGPIERYLSRIDVLLDYQIGSMSSSGTPFRACTREQIYMS